MTGTATDGVGLLLSRLHRVRSVGDGNWMASCSAAGHGRGRGDVNPSLSISSGNGRGLLIKCFAGCETEAVLKSVGLDWQDILPPREHSVCKAERISGSRPITVADLAADKALPMEFLTSLGWEDRPDGVLIPYRKEDDSLAARQRFRTAVVARAGSKWLGRKGDGDIVPYGLNRLEEARERGFLILVEGETDAATLWLHGYPALGIPGADMTGKLQLNHVARLDRVFYYREPDQGGKTFATNVPARLREVGFRGEIREVKIDGVKDANELYKRDPAGFDAAFGKAIDEARLIGTPIPRTLFAPVADLLLNPLRPNWAVKGLIERPSTGSCFGASGAGKTLLVIDIACCFATRTPWMGKEIVADGPVFYIANEGFAGLPRRFAAWQIKRKVIIPRDRLYVSTSRTSLDAKGGEAVAAEIDRLAREAGAKPSLIVIDTLARSLPAGADENATKDMGAFVNVVDSIRDGFDCVAVIVHHTGHEEKRRSRGASSFPAALDFELCISKRGGVRVAEWTKLRDLPDDVQPQEFTLEKVLVDATEDGELVSSAVVNWQGPVTKNATAPMTKAEALALNTLRLAITKGGSLSATVDAWREEFYAKHWGDNKHAMKVAFGRVRQSLVEKDLIRIDDGRYSIPTGKGTGT